MTLLWGNPNISVASNYQLFNANIRYLEDLYIEQTRCTHKDIELKLNRTIPFTLYMAIWKSIPNKLLEYMDNRIPEINIKYPTTIEWLNKDEKGIRSIRKIIKQETPKN